MLTYLTLPIIYSTCPPLMGRTLCSCSLLGIIALRHSTRSWASFFLMLRSLRSLVITSLQRSCGRPLNPRYHVIIYSSWPNIYIHSVEVVKVSKPAPSDLFRVTNYSELFVEFLVNNTLIRCSSRTPQIQQFTNPPYHCQQMLNDVLFC